MAPRSSWLHRDTTVAATLERRAARAQQLAESSTDAAPLVFAAGLYRAQAEVASALAGRTLSGVLDEDLPGFVRALEAIAAFAGTQGPPGLRADVDAYRSEGADRLRA